MIVRLLTVSMLPAAVSGDWMVVAFAGGGYSRRCRNRHPDHAGMPWFLCDDMPPAVERLLCRALKVPCKLDPVPLADPPYVCGPQD